MESTLYLSESAGLLISAFINTSSSDAKFGCAIYKVSVSPFNDKILVKDIADFRSDYEKNGPMVEGIIPKEAI